MKKIVLTLFGVSMVLMVVACSNTPITAVEGTLVDYKDEALLEIRVVARPAQQLDGCEQRETTTNENGMFQFNELCPDAKYHLIFHRGNGVSKKINISTTSQDTMLTLDAIKIRFWHLSNNIVLDDKTNLMWAHKDNGKGMGINDVDVADTYCKTLQTGGYNDWRIPTAKEFNEINSVIDETEIEISGCCHFYFNNVRKIPFGIGHFDFMGKTCIISNPSNKVFVLPVRGGDNEYFLQRGLVYGFGKRAIEEFNHAIKIKPDFSEAYSERGNSYFTLEKYEKAIADYSKAIEISHVNHEAFSNRGLAYSRLDKNEKAIEDLTKAIKLKPDYANAYNSRAGVYYMLDRTSEACADAKRACDLGKCGMNDLFKKNGTCEQKSNYSYSSPTEKSSALRIELGGGDWFFGIIKRLEITIQGQNKYYSSTESSTSNSVQFYAPHDTYEISINAFETSGNDGRTHSMKGKVVHKCSGTSNVHIELGGGFANPSIYTTCY